MEQEKISALVEENMKTIFAYALSRVSHKEDAEDLAGDIIFAILKSAPKIRDDNAFFGYIWAIAANTYKKYLYKRSRVSFEELDEEAADDKDFIQNILRNEQFCTLRRELALLSKEYRECTIAYYFEGLSCAETASRLHISLEMVKYYLFKTRKILKEGISMEREFGTKSYQPAKFDFHIIFEGMANMEYQRLFDRKLPGNILVSTYHTPMTIRQLAIELGVASVYLEDEIALLEGYRLLTALPGGRYQARLVILTEEYMEEFFRTAEKSFVREVGSILQDMAKKLPELRKLKFAGSNLDDNCLLWDLLFEMTRKGWRIFKAGREEGFPEDGLYSKGDICYGSTYEIEKDHPYGTGGFAGYNGFYPGYAACYADYGILPEKNRFFSHGDEIIHCLEAVVADGAMASGEAVTADEAAAAAREVVASDEVMAAREPMATGEAAEICAIVPVFSREQKEAVMTIFREEIASFAGLFESLFDCALSIMRVHAPESVGKIIESATANMLIFITTGLIGGLAVKSGALTIPENDRPLGGYVYQV